jgi:hypothetical protein
MNKPMTTDIALPENKINPKPTRTEIIAALVEIARGKFIAQREEYLAELEANQTAMEKHAMTRFSAEFRTASPQIAVCYSGKIIIEFELPADAVSREHAEESELKRFRLREKFDEKATRSVIRENITGQKGTSHEERVAAILGNPDTAKYLEEVYAGFLTPPAAQDDALEA